MAKRARKTRSNNASSRRAVRAGRGRSRTVALRRRPAANVVAGPAEPPAPGREPTTGQSLASREAFFRVKLRDGTFFLAFAAKLMPGLTKNGGAQSYVPALIAAGSNAERLKRAVKDGDTMGVAFNGSQPIRFLGIDTPEKKYGAPFRLDRNGEPIFISIGGQNAAAWDAYLQAAVTPGGEHTVALSAPLRQRLAQRIAPGVAQNHATLADKASKSLFSLVSKDIGDLFGGNPDSFEIFGAMAHETFDVYGRVLAFLRPEQRDAPPHQRLPSYNTRQLAEGMALPYFIWPNIDPFRKAGLISEAVFTPPELRQRVRAAPTLRGAREAVSQARQARVPQTIFDPQQPLKLGAFELRFLADKRAPSRLVIDLAAADNEAILWPAEAYFVVPNPEDRLFLPQEYAPLFRRPEFGWRDPTEQELQAKIAAAPDVGPTGLPRV
ncbi:MAG: hypothetical protein K2Y71_25730 [Xanthobacteraceae bacterium]|nr:hypothetical protein [Xanthobacteraceae bacterium]